MLRFILQLSVFVVLLLSLDYFVIEELFNSTFSGLYYFSFLYFTSLVALIHFALQRSLQERPQKFVIRFMGAMGIKIFLSLMILVIIMYTGMDNSKQFALNYVILYLLYTAFSINRMLRAQRNESAKAKKHD